jgi:hypothetical protein
MLALVVWALCVCTFAQKDSAIWEKIEGRLVDLESMVIIQQDRIASLQGELHISDDDL